MEILQIEIHAKIFGNKGNAMKKLYLYNEKTKQYHGTIFARPDKNYLFSTSKKPPVLKQNEFAIFDEKEKSWKVIPDFRGKIFWSTSSGEMVHISKIGELPENLTDKAPDRFDIWENDEWTFNYEKWINEYVRPKRNSLLTSSDKYVAPDYPITRRNREKWKKYRQQLRDITKTIEKENENWPEAPDMNSKKKKEKTANKIEK